jgi:hypothetical protein
MQLVTVKQTEHRLATAWHVMYPLDAYALGPFRFREPVDANEAVEQAESQFGEKPKEVWPDGNEIEVDEYEYEVSVPKEDRDMYEE